MDDRLGLDHERLGALLEEVRRSLETRSPGAAGALDSFEKALLGHMEWEEKHLFPAVGARCSARSRKSIESLEIDHERIRETLTDVRTGLMNGDWPQSAQSLARAETFLEGHNYDEEHGVYVEADSLLGPGERRDLLDRFEQARGGPQG